MPETSPDRARPPNKALGVIAAFACIPAGFALPLIFGLKGLEVWPVAIGIWLTGVLLSVAELPKGGSLRRWQLFALLSNLIFVVFFGAAYFLAGSVSR